MAKRTAEQKRALGILDYDCWHAMETEMRTVLRKAFREREQCDAVVVLEELDGILAKWTMRGSEAQLARL